MKQDKPSQLAILFLRARLCKLVWKQLGNSSLLHDTSGIFAKRVSKIPRHRELKNVKTNTFEMPNGISLNFQNVFSKRFLKCRIMSLAMDKLRGKHWLSSFPEHCIRSVTAKMCAVKFTKTKMQRQRSLYLQSHNFALPDNLYPFISSLAPWLPRAWFICIVK